MTWWQRFRAWWRPPRRLHFNRSGIAFTGGIFGIGFAALNTANNLLYLLLGGMLGIIVLSGWLSEQALRSLTIRRRVPRGITAREPARIGYEIENRKKKLPSLSLEIVEKGGDARAYFPSIAPGASAPARADITFDARGVYLLTEVTLSTTFPFGLFRKERDLPMSGSVTVWPRTDRVVRAPRPAGNRARRIGVTASGAGGGRGEYRGLRSYRTGDDPRDIHWRSSARLREPVVREYERDEADSLWICLDLRAEPGTLAEAAVEIAAALGAQAMQRGERFGLVHSDGIVDAGTGLSQLEMVLDALAGVVFRSDANPPVPPVSYAEAVLVSAGTADSRYGDVYNAGDA